jgi:hypothetical protein
MMWYDFGNVYVKKVGSDNLDVWRGLAELFNMRVLKTQANNHELAYYIV